MCGLNRRVITDITGIRFCLSKVEILLRDFKEIMVAETTLLDWDNLFQMFHKSVHTSGTVTDAILICIRQCSCFWRHAIPRYL